MIKLGKMLRIKPIDWNKIFVLLILSSNFICSICSNSIMDIINMEKVEKLLAERRENATMEMKQERRFMLQNSVDGDDSYTNNDNDDDEVNSEQDPPDTSDMSKLSGTKRPKPWHRHPHYNPSTGKGYKFRSNLTGIPDVTTLLADFTTIKVDKFLKSDKNPQLVTKKEYLKKDWCKTEPIVQKIREDGCITRTILNRFCYGQCNSFYIPKNPPRRKKNQGRRKQGIQEESEDNYIFKSCGFCKPRRSYYVFVTLRCPSLIPPYRKKKVQRIKQCKCLSENFN